MKKSLLLSAAAVCALSLSAQDQAFAKVELAKQDVQLSALKSVNDEVKGSIGAVEVINTADGFKVMRQKSPVAMAQSVAKADEGSTGHYELYPLYTYPSYLFMYGYGVNVAPFDADLIYQGNCLGLSVDYPNTAEGQAQKDEDWNNIKKSMAYKWSYVDADLKNATSTERIVKVNYAPYPNLSLILPSPVVSVNDSVYDCGNDLCLMGKGYLNTSENGLVVLPLSPLNWEIIEQLGLCALAYYGSMKVSDTMTASEYGSSWLTRYTKEAMPSIASQIKAVNPIGFTQHFEKPIVPMAVSSYSFRLDVGCAAGASFKATFYKMVPDADGKLVKGDVIVEKTFTEDKAISEANQYYTVPFTSKNAYGETLSYAMVEDAMVMEITDMKDYTFMSPIYAKYNSNNVAAYYSVPYFSGVITSATMVDGTEYPLFAELPTDAYALGSDQKNYYYSYTIQGYMEAEYPVLSAIGLFADNAQDWADVASPKQVDMTLTAKNGESVIQFICSAAKDGEIQVEMADGDFLPDWLIAEPKTYLQQSSTGGYLQFANVFFSIDENELKDVDPTTWQGNIAITYKNQTVIVKVNGGTSGVNNIVGDAIDADVISSEYYDLQGRKLNAQPENGIFIQKSLLSNGKTVATKVAK